MPYFLSLLSSDSFCDFWASLIDWMIKHCTSIHLSVLSYISMSFCIKWRQRERKEGKLERSLPYITCSLLLYFSPSLASKGRLNSPQWRVRDSLGSVRSSPELGSRCHHSQTVLQKEKHLAESWRSVIPGLSLCLVEFPLLCQDAELQNPMKISM